jgi:type VI secretion system secreted protein VgrG
VNVGSDSSEQIGGSQTVAAGKDVAVTAGKKMSFTAGDDFAISGAKKGLISIADELTIRCGKALIQMKKNGDILIDGNKLDFKGKADIVMKSKKKILQN